MRKSFTILLLMLLALFAFAAPITAMAQEGTPPATSPALTLSTAYPSVVIGIGETVNMDLKLHAGDASQTAQLEVQQLPDQWTSTFNGGGEIVQAVYVPANSDATVQVRVTPPADVKAGTYQFTVIATSGSIKAELPLEVTIKSKLPPKLALSVDLPTLNGSPTTTFRYSATLKNEGDEDLSVNLLADAPSNFQVSFSLAGQDVTNIPLAANETKSISISLKPVGDVPAGTYPFTVTAQGGDAQATLNLSAEVAGTSSLTVTAPDGRLSGQAYIGKTTPIKVDISNSGTAPAQGIQLSASEPSGWTVNFNTQQIPDIPPGQQVEVTANVKPADNAVAGDYMVTVTAKTADGSSKSADFRITVLTSTLWGVAGIGLIAVALGVVGLAVVRFGRR